MEVLAEDPHNENPINVPIRVLVGLPLTFPSKPPDEPNITAFVLCVFLTWQWLWICSVLLPGPCLVLVEK